jgi:anti-anti-sigma regulatory factor
MDFLAEAPSVVLDLSDVTYIDSTVISELVWLHNARASTGREPETLVVRHPNLLRVFGILDLSEVLHIVGALDDAVVKNGRDVVVEYASAFEASATA